MDTTPTPTLHHRDTHSDAIVKWLVPDRVIYMWAQGDVSASVRSWMNAQAIFLYHSCATPKVHIVLDMQGVTGRAKGTKQDRPAVWHPRRGWIVSIGAVRSDLMRRIVNFLLNVMNLNYFDSETTEKGLALLQQADPTLPDLKPYWEKIADRQAGEQS
jgi:hypothetical protein